jgi:hypothetical protein
MGLKPISLMRKHEVGSQAAKRMAAMLSYTTKIEIDKDAREEYWVDIRKKPELKHRDHSRKWQIFEVIPSLKRRPERTKN